jgi:pyruvate dehydrogenase E2 component (dihydrolipoamide acetyltransferase)
MLMPKIGLTATEARLSGWLVEIGQEVSTGDLICEIETDKITNEIEAPASGTLLKRVEAGISVPVGEPIAVLGTSDEDVGAVRLYEPDVESVSPLAKGEAGAKGEAEGNGDARSTLDSAGRDETQLVRSSPAARRRAEELGLSLAEISGTGPGGRITLADVESASESVPDSLGGSSSGRRTRREP